ncbi:MAG: phosphogluconate dehydratase [Pseudomonadota bacterium]
MTALNATIEAVTARIRKRSKARRERYLALIDQHDASEPARLRYSDANQAHNSAGCPAHDRDLLLHARWPSIGIVTSYNDMLSAHAPFATFPDILKTAARNAKATAQVAGGVPAMCDGITQGFEGMELSLFSRDVIAMATAISLSHATFDSALCLGVCDKIVPGLLMGALRFPWLPMIMVPGGPMPSGLPNRERAAKRQLFAEGKITRAELLETEAASYHTQGTCTFYGTANSNQMMMEMMGLHIPGAAFIQPHTPLRDALTAAAATRAAEITGLGQDYRPIGRVIDDKAIVNAIVGLCASGGSTNHMIHLPAIARAAGIEIDWNDFEDISRVTPLLTRIYPNGSADVNQFHDAGGMAFLIRELLGAGLLHPDIKTIAREGFAAYATDPVLSDGALAWRPADAASGDEAILRTAASPFSAEGGLRVLRGGLGRAVVKISAVAPEHRVVEAPARVFTDQRDVARAFRDGELDCDGVIVVRGQGPRANGMPELHKLVPMLGALQDRGFKVALVTDGRMSGASGKVLAAIHVSPEAAAAGAIARLRDGDVIRVDATEGVLDVTSDPLWAERPPEPVDISEVSRGYAREMFAVFRANVADAEHGGSPLGDMD